MNRFFTAPERFGVIADEAGDDEEDQEVQDLEDESQGAEGASFIDPEIEDDEDDKVKDEEKNLSDSDEEYGRKFYYDSFELSDTNCVMLQVSRSQRNRKENKKRKKLLVD